jgi:hypothetical protein
VRIALVAALWAAGVLALGFLFPWLKEGHDVDELPLFAGMTIGLALLAFVAWKALRARPPLLAAGLLGLLLPLAAYGLLTLDILWDEWRGRSLARGARIVSVREAPIEWAGFDGPVGLRLEIELEHQVRLEGNLYPPKLRMGDVAVPGRRDYFGRMFGGSEAAFLHQPVFQFAGRWNEQPSLQGSPARLSYDLYPWKVNSYDAGRRVCFGRWDAERALSSGPGTELSACWMFAGRGGVYVDLSAPLTAELRARSRYQGRRDEWEALVRRLDPRSLPERGFVSCEDPSGDRCFCRPG